MRENPIVVKNGGKGPLFGRNQLRQQSQMFRLILSIILQRTVSVSALKSHFFLLKKFGHSCGKMEKKSHQICMACRSFCYCSANALCVCVCVCVDCVPKELFWFIIQIRFFFRYPWIFCGFVCQKKKMTKKTTEKLSNNYAWMRISNILASAYLRWIFLNGLEHGQKTHTFLSLLFHTTMSCRKVLVSSEIFWSYSARGFFFWRILTDTKIILKTRKKVQSACES